jgi:acyl carrier protein
VTDATGIEEVKAVVVETLDLADRADTLGPATPLVSAVPELDSMAVVELLVALEERFGITIENEDVIANAFETLENLTALVDAKRL